MTLGFLEKRFIAWEAVIIIIISFHGLESQTSKSEELTKVVLTLTQVVVIVVIVGLNPLLTFTTDRLGTIVLNVSCCFFSRVSHLSNSTLLSSTLSISYWDGVDAHSMHDGINISLPFSFSNQSSSVITRACLFMKHRTPTSLSWTLLLKSSSSRFLASHLMNDVLCRQWTHRRRPLHSFPPFYRAEATMKSREKETETRGWRAGVVGEFTGDRVKKVVNIMSLLFVKGSRRCCNSGEKSCKVYRLPTSVLVPPSFRPFFITQYPGNRNQQDGHALSFSTRLSSRLSISSLLFLCSSLWCPSSCDANWIVHPL